MADHKNRRTPAQDRWLRFFNRTLYTTLAPLYDALDWLTLGAWWRLVSQALVYTPTTGSVLEVGFGPGKLQAQLAQRVTFCAGIDLAGGMCRVAQRRLQRAQLTPRLARSSVLALPFPAHSFDCVVSTFAVSGFPQVEAALAEMARVLRPGGRLVLVDIGLPSDGNRVGTFWARLWERMGDYLYDFPALLTASGLHVTTYQEFGPGKHIRALVAEKP
jgi:ubiquinone/menaquinone biosynthesis C-methylase UbiE